jgi:hypothetical protein
VKELTNATAANASLVNSSLEALAQRSLQSAIDREGYLQPVVDFTAELQVDFETELAAMQLIEPKNERKAGATRSALIEGILNDLNGIEKRNAEAEEEKATIRKAFADSQVEYQIPSKALEAMAKQLAELAKDESLSGQLSFYRAFFTEAYEQYQKAQKEAGKVSDDAARESQQAASATSAVETE